MTEEREKELVEFFEAEIESQEFFEYTQWDGFIEDDDDPLTWEEVESISDKYQVVITLIPKEAN
jgi:hypothetical protein